MVTLSTPARQPRAGLTRLAVGLGLAMAVAWLLRNEWTPHPWSLLLRTVALALVAVLVFGIFERWPKRLPRWLARWALQVIAVAVAMPLTTTTLYLLSTRAGAAPFWVEPKRMEGFMMLTFLAILLAPWTTLGALLRRSDAVARAQLLAFDLERSELERQALEARLHALQARVAPHFLFNTLANVQALVESGSPKAPLVLRRLIAYLRAAVPTLTEPAATVGREVELVQAYLDLMRLRMPDRLEVTLEVDASALELGCPPTTLLTLVENAVKHGIDPSEEGGRIDIRVEHDGDRCLFRVLDSGVGLQPSPQGLGTGLTTLRQRLRLLYGDEARLEVGENPPRGVRAEVVLPARRVPE